MGKNKTDKKEEVTLSKKDAKKVQKLEAQIPYHEGRGNKEEAEKIREQIKDIWSKAALAMYD